MNVMNEEQKNTGETEMNEASEQQENNVQEQAGTAAAAEAGPDYAAMYQEMNDKFLRLYADFENLKKRTARERLEYVKTAGQDVFLAILPVLDDLDRAEKSIDSATDVQALREGVDLIFKKMRNVLQSKGLAEMQVMGEDFNPDIHDAIAQIPAPAAELKGKIIDCAEKGYTLNGAVIRVPKVVVGQ
ncbi:MAG: nucleotide exchange factor GrpE [Bacteroidia bacterium]|nr:nucleotide exchange factor GrpE [Bacteroidia bacterium]